MLSDLKIGIIGGSIAGSSLALLLKQYGADVTILERSHSLSGRGAGIVMPESLVQQCIELNLLDRSIPHLWIKGRSFFVRDENHIKKIWEQAMDVVALNWSDVYSNLRKRIPQDTYHSGVEVRKIQKLDTSYEIKTVSNIIYKFDLIIAADGIESTIRKQIYPKSMPSYAGYVAWRGTINISDIPDIHFFSEKISYFVFPGGHLLLYFIPSSNSKDGSQVLNWLLYENCEDLLSSKLLVDKNGIQHTISLPIGFLSNKHIQHIHGLAKKNLPSMVADIIYKTKNIFLQAIFDLEPSKYTDGKLCFIGDAATILRPHSGSGVVKALNDSISLAIVLNKNKSNDLLTDLSLWNEIQLNIARQQVSLAKSMGEALVTNSPPWETMDFNSMEKWWQTVMSGKKWYATSRKRG